MIDKLECILLISTLTSGNIPRSQIIDWHIHIHSRELQSTSVVDFLFQSHLIIFIRQNFTEYQPSGLFPEVMSMGGGGERNWGVGLKSRDFVYVRLTHFSVENYFLF